MINCDKNLSDQGQGEIDKVEGAETCNPTVYLNHASGCKDFDPKDHSWFAKNKYYFAVLALIVGPIIALGGKRFFPYIAAGVASLAVLILTIGICIVLGAFNTTTGLVFSLLSCLLFAILAGCFLRRAFWLNIAVLGVVGGLVIGVVLNSIFSIALKYDSDVAFIVMVCVFGTIGGIFAWRQKEEIVLYGTALIGSYILMRGIAAFYGGFPDSSKIIKDMSGTGEIEEPGLYYMSLAIFAVSFICSSAW